jgi:hypothetical protein
MQVIDDAKNDTSEDTKWLDVWKGEPEEANTYEENGDELSTEEE